MLLFIYGILNIPLVNGRARFEPFHIRAPPIVLAVCVNGIELGCPVGMNPFGCSAQYSTMLQSR